MADGAECDSEQKNKIKRIIKHLGNVKKVQNHKLACTSYLRKPLIRTNYITIKKIRRCTLFRFRTGFIGDNPQQNTSVELQRIIRTIS